MSFECDEPAISVVMAVYNDELYIERAVQSILKQSFQDFELIIVNDDSKDGTKEKLESLCMMDKRIKVLHNKKNRGLAYSLNRGIAVSKGKYIARMDGDDVALPKRLEKQYHYMENNPLIDICGSNYKKIGMDSGVVAMSNESDDIKAFLIFYSPLGHSTWFIRKSFLLEYDLKYNTKYRSAQDYELFYRCMNYANVACLQDVLLLYRVHSGSITSTNKKADENMLKVQRRVFRDLGIKVCKGDFYLWNGLYRELFWVRKIRKLFLIHRILYANKKRRIFNQSSLVKAICKECFDENKSVKKILQKTYV